MKLGRLIVTTLLASTSVFGQEPAPTTTTPVVPPVGNAQPYRTFVTVMRYNLETNGRPASPVSNVKVEVTFPNGTTLTLPEGGEFWSVGNGQSQEINRTFEIPWAYVQRDGFNLRVQLVHQGHKINPCEIDVSTLSQFNRAYNCMTDVAQQLKDTPPDRVVKQGVQLRVFTDKNSEPKEIPQNAIALK